ncbi:alpha/beta hydrolase [Polynucleobacter asymbioticus]|jgi:haloacetate dehalogenase|uniref:Alpha/beta hydrolase fold protein n=2 Tax=Polynucleobacter asymbioticus TaxID=576611 RepID=A4SXI5_POLAQ|nr:alpha/beta hydrolase [Polynucleobacter asymbioticus]ABP34199.1 alpha/beta hydrolase fold protein [Polynucleobacter asymbioticus QLW-P1DMWA-1]APB98859.1 alpha/beta hydrolase [Polynucleobacter asymbioticus]APC01162.1 alpha/beta hydrolase [Polynucleobacter asymbioticus]APC06038.1 alpha/beta hydrolase [Polynucleobacter asymbioticus]
MPIQFLGFEQKRITVPSADGPIEIACQIGGSGPALLLLHGFPQTKAIWHKVGPALAKNYTVVIPDLRGYGASSKPNGKDDHSTYSKRSMAADQHALMKELGHEQFFLLGHDRGGRVSHRLAMDFPQSVKRLMVLDISPTLAMYENTTMQFARGYWHWFFLIQPAPIPEAMIAANPEFWLKKHMGRHAGTGIFSADRWTEYLSAVSDPQCMHAMCEDYRAAASIDLVHDREDRAEGKKLVMPLRVLWGEHGLVEKCFKPIDDWSNASKSEVTGKALACGHYIPEELPDTLIEEARTFFSQGVGGEVAVKINKT